MLNEKLKKKKVLKDDKYKKDTGKNDQWQTSEIMEEINNIAQLNAKSNMKYRKEWKCTRVEKGTKNVLEINFHFEYLSLRLGFVGHG